MPPWWMSGAAARRRPVLLVIEDAHWADQSSRDLVDYVLRSVCDERLAVLVTFRTDDPAFVDVAGFVANMTAMPHASTVAVASLTSAEVVQQVAHLHGGAELGGSMRSRHRGSVAGRPDGGRAGLGVCTLAGRLRRSAGRGCRRRALVRWARTVSFRHALLREAAVSRLMPQGRRAAPSMEPRDREASDRPGPDGVRSTSPRRGRQGWPGAGSLSASRGARGADVCVPGAPSDAAPCGRPVGSGAGGAGTHGHRPLGSARRRNRAAHLTLGRIEESQRLSTRPGRCCPRTPHPCGRRCSTCCGTGRAGWRRPPHHGGDPLRGSTGTSRTTRSPSTTCWRPATPTPRRRATAATSPGSAGRWRQR
jgi:hypothetical protein